MAVVQLQVINPTAAPVTVGANTAAANAVTQLGIDNATADAYTFLAGGCALASAAAGTVVSREQAGWLLYTGQAKG
jgi:hypothetical protein